MWTSPPTNLPEDFQNSVGSSRKPTQHFAAPVFLFAEQSPLLTEASDLRVYDPSVFDVNRAAEILRVAAACQRVGVF